MADFDREKIINKVRGLRAHAASAKEIGSDAEAHSFATKMQAMMSEHKILMSEIEHAKLDETDPVVEVYTDGSVPRGRGRRESPRARVEWFEHLAGVVASASYCRLLVSHRSARIYFAGREADAQVCLETFSYLADCAAELADQAYKKAYAEAQAGKSAWTPGYHRSYLIGFAVRLRERYEEEMDRMKAAWAASGTAVARINDALTVVDKFLAKKNSGTAKVPKSKGITNMAAFSAGKKAANDLKLREESKKIK